MYNNFDINQNAVKILRILESHKFQAYIVGGAVRDILMGKPPHDYDVCTDALPDDIKDIFGNLGYKTVLVGEKYGTVQVLSDGESFEVTTFRIDNEYIDGRRPESVNFSKNIADDLKRRDFTINALACSVDENNIKIIDFFGGQSDIKNKIIRAVGNPFERFSEDALRMIRAVRFSAQLGFEIEPETKSAIRELAENITFVSKERITVEIEKILLSDNPEKFFDLSELNLLGYIMPNFKGDHNDEKINKIKLLGKDFCVRFAAVLELCSNNTDDLKNLRLKNDDVKNITNIMDDLNIIKIFNFQMSKELLKQIMRDFGLYAAQSMLNIMKIIYDTDFFDILYEIESNNEPYKLSHLKINGDDIIEIDGEISGRNIGAILTECLSQVIEDPEKNTREFLIDFAEKYYKYKINFKEKN